jgi:hypothetical protein
MVNKSPFVLSMLIKGKEGLNWTRDKSGLILLNSHQTNFLELKGFEAAVWEWMSIWSWPEILTLTGAYFEISEEIAEEKLIATFIEWRKMGLIDILKG